MKLSESILTNIKESYDKTNYIDNIKKATKDWWKQNADLGTRIFKGTPEFDYKRTDDGIYYYITISNTFVDTEEFAEDIGKYVSDKTPHTEYVDFKVVKDEDDRQGNRVIIRLFQEISNNIDFADNIY